LNSCTANVEGYVKPFLEWAGWSKCQILMGFVEVEHAFHLKLLFLLVYEKLWEWNRALCMVPIGIASQESILTRANWLTPILSCHNHLH
jgi:hypothetical protein